MRAGSKPKGNSLNVGPWLVGMGAALWATDAVFRYSTLKHLSPLGLVTWEHLIALTALSVPTFALYRSEVMNVRGSAWLGLILAGAGGSALATFLFTASFALINPSVAILLQKTQPILVVLLAWAFLKERPQKGFWAWGSCALAAAIILSFPDLDFTFLRNGLDWRSKGVLYAACASAIWAITTVASRAMLKSLSPTVATFWRYCFGLVALLILTAYSNQWVSWSAITDSGAFTPVLYMSLVSGLLAMLLYYNGLSQTPASVATFIELIFPVAAVLLNTAVLGTRLVPTQWLAGAILLFSVSKISTRGA